LHGRIEIEHAETTAVMNERPDLAVMMFDYVPSGVVRNAIRIAGAAQQAGIRTEIWTAQGIGEMSEEVPPGVRVRSLGLTLGELYTPRARKRALGRIAKPLADMLRQFRPRILLSAGNHFHKVAVEAINQLDEPERPRLIGRVSNALPRFSWKPAKLPGSVIKRLRTRSRYKAMQRLIAVSDQVRHDLTNRLLISPAELIVIPNGVDLAEVQRLAQERVDHPWLAKGAIPVVVAAGRLTHQKGFDILLRAFAIARQRRPMHLIVLGEGPEKYQLEALADELGISADVAFEGHVNNPIAYFRRASVFVLPSRWEGLSNALLEALASGVPVVATRCPGSVELLDGGKCGSLVDVGDVKGLSDGIVAALAQKPSSSRQLKRAKDYDLASTLSAYVDVIREELGKLPREAELQATANCSSG
jgi:glycosyltransferase involved in cell wall biosynthesis